MYSEKKAFTFSTVMCFHTLSPVMMSLCVCACLCVVTAGSRAVQIIRRCSRSRVQVIIIIIINVPVVFASVGQLVCLSD